MSFRRRFKNAHADENKIVSEYWIKNHPSTRIAGSGNGRFCGDILTFLDNKIEIAHVRRHKREKIKENIGIIVFKKQEIEDAIMLIEQLSEKLPSVKMQVALIAHFPENRIWAKTLITPEWKTNKKDISCITKEGVIEWN